jgi:predicted pyridoxine 5'-phosphate oxidase superfamily flavin-nucleotide-binding protein
MEIGGEIKSLIEGSNLVYVGTSDRNGKVHLSVTGGMRIPDERHVAFEEWFCSGTLENLKENPQISIGVIDPQTGKGYQLIGEVEDVDVGVMLNGFVKDKEEEWKRYPQSQHQLYIRVDSIMELNTGPHSDEEIE